MSARSHRITSSAFLGSVIAAAVAAASCGDTAVQSNSPDAGVSVSVSSNYPCDGCMPFPGQDTPSCPMTTLGSTLIAYPPDGVLLPPNLNMLAVQFVPPARATLFEVDFDNDVIHVTVETQCNPITPVRGGASTGCGVTLPQGAWNDIANNNRGGASVHVTVRATVDGSCVSTSATKIDLLFAEEDMHGGLYFWQWAIYGGIPGETGGIYSHDFGLHEPTPTPFYTSGGMGTCAGCHYPSRDGLRIALSTDDPDGDDEFGDMQAHVMDVVSRSVLGGQNMSPGSQTFSNDHMRIVASTFKGGANKSFLVWNDSATTTLATDPLPTGVAATQPDLSKDDQTLVYVVPQSGTILRTGDHHFVGGSLFFSTFDAQNQLGAPTSLLPSNGSNNFYYPNISSDASFLVFNEAPDGDAYYNRNARVKLLHWPPMASAQPIDLPALNVADGLTNSWPRWSPFVQTYKTHKILWLTFSSNRDYGLRLKNQNANFQRCYPPEGPAGAPYNDNVPPNIILTVVNSMSFANCEQPQLWMAAVIIDPDTSLDSQDRSFPERSPHFSDDTKSGAAPGVGG